MICQVTNKGDLTRSSKTLNQFNDDVEEYNTDLCRMLKLDNKVVHWRHKRLYENLEGSTDDGTHLDTIEGKLRYKNPFMELLEKQQDK